LDTGDTFRIGERNYVVLKTLLTKNVVPIDAADVGGTTNRTVYFDVTTGQVLVSMNGKKDEL